MNQHLTRYRCDFCAARVEVPLRSGLPKGWVRVVAQTQGKRRPEPFDLCPAHVPTANRCSIEGCLLPRDGGHSICSAHHKRQVRGQPLGFITPRSGRGDALRRNAIGYADAVGSKAKDAAAGRLYASARYFARGSHSWKPPDA